MKKAQKKLVEFKPDDSVIYVPYHAHGDRTHKDCERGRVSSVTEHYVFVKFNETVSRLGWQGTTAQAFKPEQLCMEYQDGDKAFGSSVDYQLRTDTLAQERYELVKLYAGQALAGAHSDHKVDTSSEAKALIATAILLADEVIKLHPLYKDIGKEVG